MFLTTWDPFKDLEPLEDTFRGLFGRQRSGSWAPHTDIREENDKIVMAVDLPGLQQEDISVNINNGILTIKGERKWEEKENEGKYLHRERHISFHRAFSLPDTVDQNKVDAQYKDGVLQLDLHKAEIATPKQIDVKVK